MGHYDTRLTSTQDLDFWVRAVLADVNLHVVDRPVTAFRIRDGRRNASAPRRDTALRFDFEFRQILRHFAWPISPPSAPAKRHCGPTRRQNVLIGKPALPRNNATGQI